jgi:predicted phage tail component-like protein
MSELPVPAFSVLFNGIELNQWLDVYDVQRNVGQNRISTLQQVGRADGQVFQYNAAGVGTINVSATILNNLINKRRELAAALYSSEPVRLIFGDEPDKYYLAVVEGDAAMSETNIVGDLTIKFTVPDDMIHAVDPVEFDDDGAGEMTVTNNGTAATYPVIEATMQSDNGFLGLSTDSGAELSFGDTAEVDTVPAPSSESAMHYSLTEAPDGAVLNAGVIAYPAVDGYPDHVSIQKGSFRYNATPEEAAALFPDETYMPGAQPIWGGPSLHYDLEPNYAGDASGGFDYHNRFDFQGIYKGDRFRLETTAETGGTSFLTAIVRSSTPLKNDLWLDVYLEGKRVSKQDISRMLEPAKYNKTVKETPKKAFIEVRLKRRGTLLTVLVRRFGKTNGHYTPTKYDDDVISAVWDCYMDGADEVGIDGTTTWMSAYAMKTDGMNIFWSNSQFTWVNAAADVDVPNTFSTGDVVTLDVQHRKLLVNGVASTSLYTVGNGWAGFKLPPGETIIQITASEFAQPPKVHLTLEEAYL